MAPSTVALIVTVVIITNFIFGTLSFLMVRTVCKDYPLTLADLINLHVTGILGTIALVIWYVMRTLDRVIIVGPRPSKAKKRRR